VSESLLLEYTKALAWPVITLIGLAAFWKPLRDMARMLPGMLANTETIQLGSVSLRVRAQIKQTATDEVRKVLRKLDPNTLRYILAEDGGETELYGEDNEDLASANNLVRLGLARSSKGRPRDHEETGPPTASFVTTDLYDDTRAFLLELIPELVAQHQRSEGVGPGRESPTVDNESPEREDTVQAEKTGSPKRKSGVSKTTRRSLPI